MLLRSNAGHRSRPRRPRSHVRLGGSGLVGVGKTRKKGDFEQLLGDVTSRVFNVYDDATVVYPGHGNDITFGVERPNLDEWKQRGW